MKEMTLGESYGIESLTKLCRILGFDAGLTDEIVSMAEWEIPTSAEIDAMRAHVTERLDWLDSLPWREQSSHSAAVFDEVRSVMAAADRYGRLRRALHEIRFSMRFPPKELAA